jgi:hypothetical protein
MRFVLLLAMMWGNMAVAQDAPPAGDARELVQQTVDNELAADRDDHSHWQYRDADKSHGQDVVKLVVETAACDVTKTVEKNGRALTPEEQADESKRLQGFAQDKGAQRKQIQEQKSDDQRATAMLKMLPGAFVWTVTKRSDNTITLAFKPDPKFRPPDREARVFAAMTGEMVIAAQQKRIRELKGTLLSEVDFGWGLLGKLEPGGTFLIERREVGAGVWEITATHVHMRGHALLFKTISEQEDEEKNEFKPVPDGTTVEQAVGMLSAR